MTIRELLTIEEKLLWAVSALEDVRELYQKNFIVVKDEEFIIADKEKLDFYQNQYENLVLLIKDTNKLRKEILEKELDFPYKRKYIKEVK